MADYFGTLRKHSVNSISSGVINHWDSESGASDADYSVDITVNNVLCAFTYVNAGGDFGHAYILPLDSNDWSVDVSYTMGESSGSNHYDYRNVYFQPTTIPIWIDSPHSYFDAEYNTQGAQANYDSQIRGYKILGFTDYQFLPTSGIDYLVSRNSILISGQNHFSDTKSQHLFPMVGAQKLVPFTFSHVSEMNSGFMARDFFNAENEYTWLSTSYAYLAFIMRILMIGSDDWERDIGVNPPAQVVATIYVDRSTPPNIRIAWDLEGETDEPPNVFEVVFQDVVSQSNNVKVFQFTDGYCEYTWGMIEMMVGVSNLNNLLIHCELPSTADRTTSSVLYTPLTHNVLVAPRAPQTHGFLTTQIRAWDSTSDEPEDNDRGYRDRVDDSDGEDDNTSTQTANLLTRTYKLTDLQLRALNNFMWSSSFIDNIKLVNNDPIQNVVSLKAIPIDIEGSASTVVLGNVNTGVAGLSVSENYKKIDIGSITVPRIYNNFVDYEHAKIEIYLPLIGTITDLNPKEVIGYTITLKYCFDLITGDCLAMIFNNRGGGVNCIGIYKGNCGIDIPLTASNRAQVEAGYVSDFVNGVTNFASGNVAGVANNAMNAVTRMYSSKSSGNVSGVTAQGLPNRAYLTIIENVSQVPAHYAHTFGRPCGLGLNLGDCRGFTKTSDLVDLSDISCTEREREEIRRLLSTGVYL